MPIYVPPSGKELRPSESKVRDAVIAIMRIMEGLDPVFGGLTRRAMAPRLTLLIDSMLPFPFDAHIILGHTLIEQLQRKRFSKVAIQAAWTWLVLERQYLNVALWQLLDGRFRVEEADIAIRGNRVVQQWHLWSDDQWSELYRWWGIPDDRLKAMPVYIPFRLDQAKHMKLPLERMVLWVSEIGRQRWQEYSENHDAFFSDRDHYAEGIRRRQTEWATIPDSMWREIKTKVVDPMKPQSRLKLVLREICERDDHHIQLEEIRDFFEWRIDGFEHNAIYEKFKGAAKIAKQALGRGPLFCKFVRVDQGITIQRDKARFLKAGTR